MKVHVPESCFKCEDCIRGIYQANDEGICTRVRPAGREELFDTFKSPPEWCPRRRQAASIYYPNGSDKYVDIDEAIVRYNIHGKYKHELVGRDGRVYVLYEIK
jgi:hypothetical protein